MNQEHYNIIRQGVKVWNQWREYNPDIKPDLKNADLWLIDFREINLSGADFRGADFWGADLSGANLSGANLSGADLRETDLREANLNFTVRSGMKVNEYTKF